jgi:hypothetical protein
MQLGMPISRHPTPHAGYLARGGTNSPLTRERFSSSRLRPNRVAKSLLEQLAQAGD